LRTRRENEASTGCRFDTVLDRCIKYESEDIPGQQRARVRGNHRLNWKAVRTVETRMKGAVTLEASWKSDLTGSQALCPLLRGELTIEWLMDEKNE
jgi:hypothetical protein